MARTRLAVQLATSLALCTKWRLATGFVVLEEAIRHELHSADVCLATMVAADNTCSCTKTAKLAAVRQNSNHGHLLCRLSVRL